MMLQLERDTTNVFSFRCFTFFDKPTLNLELNHNICVQTCGSTISSSEGGWVCLKLWLAHVLATKRLTIIQGCCALEHTFPWVCAVKTCVL